ncbi:MAG: GHKL domain-containing protein [Cyclobacteriaceae bacterium]|nr:GHKL domain-containing protein [Cyclobacteriaceae bacterium]
MMNKKLWIAILVLQPWLLSAQMGMPKTKIYDFSFDDSGSIWGILQDKRGVLYFTADNGLFEYDGVKFTKIEIVNPMGIAMDDDGDIYVSAYEEFGVLESDAKGKVRFKSLLPLIKDSVSLGVPRSVVVLKNLIYCISNRMILEYDKSKNSIKTYYPQEGSFFINGFVRDNALYTSGFNKGWMQIKDGEIAVAPYGDSLKSYQNGLYNTSFVRDGRNYVFAFYYLIEYFGASRPPIIKKLLSPYLSGTAIYHASPLSSNHYVLATYNGGAFLMDSSSQVVNHYTDSTGFPGRDVVHTFQDQSDNIWLAFMQGKYILAKTEPGLDLSIWNEKNGITGTIKSMIKYKGEMYIATNQNLFIIDSKGNARNYFPKHTNLYGIIQMKVNGDERLLIYGRKGIELLDPIKKVEESIYPGLKQLREITPSKSFANVLFVQDQDQFGYLEFKNKKWTYTLLEKGLLAEYVVEDQKGNLWIKDGLKRSLIRMRLTNKEGQLAIDSKEEIDTKQDLPDGVIYVTSVNDEILFLAKKGIFHLNERTGKLEPWQKLGKKYDEIVKQATMIMQAPNDGTLYFSTKPSFDINLRLYKNAQGDTIVDDKSFKRFPDIAEWAATVLDDGTVWLGGARGLIKFDPSKITKSFPSDFNCLIRQVTLNNDSILFGGGLKETDALNANLQLNYNPGNLVIHFAAPFFDSEEETQYSYQLQGGDETWSDWEKKSFKEYSYLLEGNYTFKVKAKNIYGQESKVGTISFRILPPWYRSVWAYLFYAIAFGVFIFVIVRWRTQNLHKKKKELETLVSLKTHELLEANEQLELSHEQLTESNNQLQENHKQLVDINKELETSQEELRQSNDELMAVNEYLKKAQRQLVESEKMASLGQLTAGIAHEINNPINFISGGVQALEVLQNELMESHNKSTEEIQQAKQDIQDLMNSIHNGVTRTADIIKSLRTFSSPVEGIDAHADILESIESALILTGSKIVDNGIVVEKKIEHHSRAKANSPQISQVVINLIDNSIHALKSLDGKKHISIVSFETENQIIIKVKDNGSGIPLENQPHIFEPFYTTKEVGAGTGLGLSICYAIIEKHKGSLTFVSKPGEGTEFTIALPKAETA